MLRKDAVDVQREGLAKKQPYEKTLAQLFAFTGNGNRVGVATLWVSYICRGGQQYGSSKTIHEVCLEGREYTLTQSILCPWSIHLLFTDETYAPRKKMRPLIRLTG